MSDGGLRDARLDLARAGDVAAFTSLLREHDDAMRAVVWSVVQDRWLMDDVLQVAYEKAYVSLPGFRGDSSFRTWLHRICWTTAIDTLRAEGRRRWSPIGEEAEATPSAVAGPEQRTVDRLSITAAFAALSPDQRTAIALVLLDGLTYEEAGRVCGAPAGTVAARVSRGRARLVELLGDDAPRGRTGPAGSVPAGRQAGRPAAGRAPPRGSSLRGVPDAPGDGRADERRDERPDERPAPQEGGRP